MITFNFIKVLGCALAGTAKSSFKTIQIFTKEN
jgi:hypothetical protein